MLAVRYKLIRSGGKTAIGTITFLFFLVALQIANAQMRAEDSNRSLTLKSGAFQDGGKIPSRYTCEGKDIAPPLSWDGVPGDARSLVLFVDDPDAPDPRAPQMTWVHWVLYNIPPRTRGLSGGPGGGDLPDSTGAGLNDWNRTGYGGPCPPIGRHRYFFKVYALDKVLQFGSKPTKKEVEAAMDNHVIAWGWLVGTYKK